ncbi:MAG TPA: V-type ATP synthase subunit F [Sedimentisphaerales bacterium]|nr:V-type ATP synthase subunit F [Sedimentisphaerales bacterium]
MEGKIAVIGDTDFVMPFSALGLDTYATGDTADDITENAKKIIDAKYALVVVAENIAPAVEEVFSAYQNAPTPCVVVVPFTTESEGFATQALGEVLKLATGINILQDS